MIAVCNKCGKMFETTYEDACTPGTLCPPCHFAAAGCCEGGPLDGNRRPAEASDQAEGEGLSHEA